jgi:hypothetical protein
MLLTKEYPGAATEGVFRVPPSISQVISKAFGCEWFYITTSSAKHSAGKFEDYDRFVPNASSTRQRGQVCTFCLDVFIRRWFVAHFRCCLHQILYVFICPFTTHPSIPLSSLNYAAGGRV